MSAAPYAVRALQLRIVGATALALASVVLGERAVNGWLDLGAHQLRQQTVAWIAYTGAFWLLFSLYTWRALGPLAQAPGDTADDGDAPQRAAAARTIALRFPAAALGLGVSLAFAMVASKLALDVLVFGLPWSFAALLALCASSAILAAGAVIYALVRRWLRPLVLQLCAETATPGMRFGLRARVLFVAATALAATVPALAIATAQLQRIEVDATARSHQRLAALLAHAGRAVGPDALREIAAGLAPDGARVVFGDTPEPQASRLPAGHRATHVAIRGGVAGAAGGAALALHALLAALLCLGAWLAWELGSNLRHDVRRVAGRINAVATLQLADTTAGSEPWPPGALQFRELRRLADGVNALLARITDLQLATFLAVERTLEADRLRTQFLANMSHDLRSPLNAILGYCELLLHADRSPLSTEQQRVVALIQRNGAALLRAITQVLDLARVRSRRMALHLENSPVAEVLTTALRLIDERGLPPELELETILRPGLPVLRLDPQRVAEAIAGITWFCATAHPRRVTIRLGSTPPTSDDPRHALLVEVEDDAAAPLLAADSALAADPDPRPGHRGLGLELPLARAFIELHEGTLELCPPSSGGGHRFVARIPAVARTSASLRPLKL